MARDVMLGNYVVIPRGSRGYGQISYRTGKGAFGKSAKMEFDIVDLQVGGQPIPLTGHYRIEGQGNTGATVGAVVAVGVFSAFVTGHSAMIAQGTEYKAFTTNALPITLAVAPPVMTAPAPATVSARAQPVLPLVPVAEALRPAPAIASNAVAPSRAEPISAPAPAGPRLITCADGTSMYTSDVTATDNAKCGR